MLDSFLVRNFRLFEYVKLDHLSQVNLFVGKNNSGKSCLLEALQVYASNASLRVLFELISAHDGNWEAVIEPESDTAPQRSNSPLKALFRGFHLPNAGAPGIEVGPSGDPKQRIVLQAEAYQTVQEGGVIRRAPVSGSEVSDLVNVEFWLVAREGARTAFLIPLQILEDPSYVPRLGFGGRVAGEREFKYPFYTVPALSLTDRQVAGLWDKVHLTDLENEVIAGLQLVHPRISGVAFLGETRGMGEPGTDGRRVAVVRLSDSSERYPLKSMGDGLSRVLQVILALVSAKDGILLVDEFENGLHWTVQPKLWKLAFRLAKRLNVQIFATTHSQDCVRAFSSAWQYDEEAGSFHRLDRGSENGVRVTAYDRTTLSDSMETEVEVR